MLDLRHRIARTIQCGLAAMLLLAGGTTLAAEASYRVAVIGNSPPMSYVDEQGKLNGFNVAMAHALCEAMNARCELQAVPLDKVVDMVAAGDIDFAVVSLLVTPERQQKVLFSKPYYHSMSIWLAKPATAPGKSGASVAVVRGSAQARYAEAQGWKVIAVTTHTELPALLASGTADAAVVPMPTALGMMQEKSLQALGLKPTVLADPLLAGDVSISVDPRRPKLKEQIDAAIDQVKRDGRYDRINTQFLPFRLQ